MHRRFVRLAHPPNDFMSDKVAAEFVSEMEKRGLELRKAGKYREATEVFEGIVRQFPDWEHGTAQYTLAGCYEELREYEKAGRCFRKALEYAPNDPYFLGDYASFLQLHGKPSEALIMHLRLIEADGLPKKDETGYIKSLQELGSQAGLSPAETGVKISQAAERWRSKHRNV